MTFLDPKIDIAFKRLFGDQTHKNIIMSFLNSILDRKGDAIIVDVVINDPHNLPERIGAKASIVDVRCTDQANRRYIVEMQVVRQKDYLQRAQYYTGLALGRQLEKKSEYNELDQVIFVGILNFDIFENPNYISHHLILDAEIHKQELKHLEFHFVELQKFHKELHELITLSDKWIYFLKYARTMETIPNILKDPDMEDAFHILDKSRWSSKSLDLYDRELDIVRSEKGRLDFAREDGEAKGEAKGEVKGEAKAKMIVAKKLLKLHDVETVAEITELDIETVKKLKADH